MARWPRQSLRQDMQRRRDAWANAAQFGGYGFAREACLRIVEELDRDIARYDELTPPDSVGDGAPERRG